MRILTKIKELVLKILTEQEQKELKKLEKENMKTVEEVYKALKEDTNVKELIEKIKCYEWVEIIEGEG